MGDSTTTEITTSRRPLPQTPPERPCSERGAASAHREGAYGKTPAAYPSGAPLARRWEWPAARRRACSGPYRGPGRVALRGSACAQGGALLQNPRGALCPLATGRGPTGKPPRRALPAGHREGPYWKTPSCIPHPELSCSERGSGLCAQGGALLQNPRRWPTTEPCTVWRVARLSGIGRGPTAKPPAAYHIRSCFARSVGAAQRMAAGRSFVEFWDCLCALWLCLVFVLSRPTIALAANHSRHLRSESGFGTDTSCGGGAGAPGWQPHPLGSFPWAWALASSWSCPSLPAASWTASPLLDHHILAGRCLQHLEPVRGPALRVCHARGYSSFGQYVAAGFVSSS